MWLSLLVIINIASATVVAAGQLSVSLANLELLEIILKCLHLMHFIMKLVQDD